VTPLQSFRHLFIYLSFVAPYLFRHPFAALSSAAHARDIIINTILTNAITLLQELYLVHGAQIAALLCDTIRESGTNGESYQKVIEN